MNSHDLKRRLRLLGRRAFTVKLGSGLAWGAIAAALVVFAGAWFDLAIELSSTLRTAVVICAAASLFVLVARYWLRARRDARPLEIARRLDGAALAGGQIACGADLLADDRSLPDVSAALAKLASERAAQLAAGIPAAAAVPVRPVTRALAALALALGVFVAVAAASPRLFQTQWLRFYDPFGDHPPYSPIVLTVEPGDMSVVFGKSADVRAEAKGGPVERVELVMQPTGTGAAESVVPMFPESPEKWRATVINVSEPARYFVRAERARSRRYAIDVVTVPEIAGVRARVTQPEYTKISPLEGPLPKEGISGLKGTKVEIWASSNRPLSGGTLIVPSDGGAPVELSLIPTAEGATEVAGSFEIHAEGKMELRVTDVAGQRSTDVATTLVRMLVDERPFVRILEPKEMSFATPEVTLGVVISAEDDYGVSRVELYRSLNGSRALPLPFEFAAPARRQEMETHLPLSSYGLVAGDEIQLFARVLDNDPAGPKGSESTVTTIRIISPEDFDRMVQTQQGMEAMLARYQEAQRRLESLAEEAKKLEEALASANPDDPASQELKEALKRLEERIREEAKAISDSAKKPLPYDLDKQLAPKLAKLADKLEKAAGACRDCAAKPGLKNSALSDQVKELRKQLADERKEFDQEAMDPLRHLANIYPLLEDESRFLQLYQRQRDLARRLESLQGREGADDPLLRARARDLESEQRRLRDELAALADDIESHAAQLPDDPEVKKLRETAVEFAGLLRSCGAREAMADCEAGLSEFATTNAADSAQRAADSARQAADLLEKLIAQCCSGKDGMGEQCKGCLKFQPKLNDRLGNTLDQLLGKAGFGQNTGRGVGAGSGYSAQRNTLNNVGMYGSRPTMMAKSGRGSGNNQAGDGGRFRGSAGRDTPMTRIDAGRVREAVGSADAVVPSEYRGRVAEYFRRLADEAADRR